MTRPPRLLAALLPVVLLLAAACGGGAGDGPISEEEARAAANRFGVVTLGMFTGDTEVDEFVGLFAPECTEGVNEEAIAFVILFMASFAPELEDLDIEEVDVGAVTVEETDDGTLVRPVDPAALRIRVDGEFVSPEEAFGDSGFAATGGDSEPLLLVRRDGAIKIGDCAELQEMSEGFSTS